MVEARVAHRQRRARVLARRCVIIAGFAIVAALLGDRYTRLLQRSNTSTIGVLQHFLLIAGLMVASIIATLAFKTQPGRLPATTISWPCRSSSA
jgi:heme A synthase